VRIAILGPLTVHGPDGPVEIGGARLRTLLIRLALDAGRTVPTDALVDAIWPDQPPAAAGNALQALVSRLRRALPEPSRLAAVPTGYRLDPREVDTAEFERDCAAGRAALAAGDWSRAAELLTAALARWRGPALADVADAGFARATALRLEELRLAATEDRIEADLGRGREAEVVAELTALTSRYPLRERGYALLMRALDALGRTGEALRVYERLRRTLADELGTDPGPALAALHLTLLRGAHGPAGNLRAALTSFVGRDADLSRVAELLEQARLVTLVGPGGAGKTRLAVAAGQRLAPGVPDGVWLVELAPVRDPGAVPAAVLEAVRPGRMRLEGGPARDPLDQLVTTLTGKRLLILLDNCEHLVEASAHLVEAVLGACPEVRILATSREPLAFTGEVLCPVGPLPAPPESADTGTALGFAAVRLFADRAGAVRPGFAVTDGNVAQVIAICRRLDGLPLAIELATARLRTLPLDQVAARLDDRFRLLTGGSRTALPRHQTLESVVAWSWDLLDEIEQRLARRLSVFLDGTTAEAAEAVCDADLDTLGALVDKSFVTLGDDGRYHMLETIRAYAAARLAEAGEADRIRDAHAAYLVRLTETGEPMLHTREQLVWLDRLGAEWDNLTAALHWTIERGDAVSAVRLTGSLGWYWGLRNQHAEAIDWLGQALALPGEVPAADRAHALANYALNLIAADEHELSRKSRAEAAELNPGHPLVALTALMDGLFHNDHELIEQELPAVLAHPDPWTRAVGLGIRARYRLESGDPDGAEVDGAEAVAALRTIGDRWALAIMLSSLAEPRALRGDHAGAIEVLTEAVALADELGVDDDLLLARYGLALERAEAGDLAGARAELDRAIANRGNAPRMRELMVEVGTADLARISGDPGTALPRYRRALELKTGIPALPAEVGQFVLLNLGRAALATGDLEQARQAADQVNDGPFAGRPNLAGLAELYAGIALAQGDPVNAARLLGCAEAIRGLANQGSRELARLMTAVQDALGPGTYAREYAQARAYSLDEARAAVRLYAGRP
jgi:predicted ATPase/DNA-binding SARP family transcriptional activator